MTVEYNGVPYIYFDTHTSTAHTENVHCEVSEQQQQQQQQRQPIYFIQRKEVEKKTKTETKRVCSRVESAVRVVHVE